MRGFLQNNPTQIDSAESAMVCILRFNLKEIRWMEALEILEIRHILSRIDEKMVENVFFNTMCACELPAFTLDYHGLTSSGMAESRRSAA